MVCSVYTRPTPTVGSNGENLYTWPSSASYTLIGCTAQDTSAFQSDAFGRPGDVQSKELFFAAGDAAKFTNGDRVVFTTGGPSGDWTVKGAVLDDAGRGAYGRVIIEQKTGGGER